MTQQYETFLRILLTQLFLWRMANPKANLTFQWNHNSKVGLIATMADAIEHKFVSMNDEARAMVTELGWDNRTTYAPSVMQVKMAIDTIYGDANAAKC